jgi:hypothetical protein
MPVSHMKVVSAEFVAPITLKNNSKSCFHFLDLSHVDFHLKNQFLSFDWKPRIKEYYRKMISFGSFRIS